MSSSRSSRDVADHPFLKGHTRWREGADNGVLLDIGILQMGGECWLSVLRKRKLLQVQHARVTCITRREATGTAFLPVNYASPSSGSIQQDAPLVMALPSKREAEQRDC